MGKIYDMVQRTCDRIAYGTPEQQAADERGEAMNRALNCPNCGDSNSSVASEAPSSTHTRSYCAQMVDMDGSICGCQHLYHAG